VVGPDVGKRAMGTKQVRDSPTVAAAAYAAREAKIPAIAFSNTRGPPSDYRDLYWKNSNRVNDGLAMDIIEALTSSNHDPKPFLPDNTFLNVNFPPWDVRYCHSRKQIKLILTRVNPSKGFDAHQCGSFYLPMEEDVKKVKSIQHCYATVSLVNAKDMTSDNVEGQKLIRDELGKLLECV
jgi:broad specificity polyphosphatase/5'/3'-nucleotidase SurE